MSHEAMGIYVVMHMIILYTSPVHVWPVLTSESCSCTDKTRTRERERRGGWLAAWLMTTWCI